MRCSLGALLLLMLAAPLAARAGDAKKANALTPAEARDGWLLLFDGKSPFGWDVEGEAAVENGALVFGGKKTTVATFNTQFSSFELRLESRCEGAENGKLVIRRGNTIRSESLERSPAGNPGWDTFRLKIVFDPARMSEVQEVEATTAGGAKISGKGSGQGVNGSAQFRIEAPKGSRVFVRNIKLRPLELKSIFNGKDLTGWKVFPGKKSKFTVNDRGELNVKDGPGDLQTEGKYSDFVLQLECISNGKHLNSGVFFRCRAGEYQNGYEAQIRNEFTAEPKQTYKVEVCDPNTGQVTVKQIKSPAVDYGTGAIYRRMPARLQASKDGEWFMMTVVAQGKHFATWVNGIPVVDWTDCRPLSDNARKGCCLKPGHISLQGHDTTTDLSFRNFRIAELPASGR
jgi:hypothetical protein